MTDRTPLDFADDYGRGPASRHEQEGRTEPTLPEDYNRNGPPPRGVINMAWFRVNHSRPDLYIATCRCVGLFHPDRFATGPQGHATLEEATSALVDHIFERHAPDDGSNNLTREQAHAFLMRQWKLQERPPRKVADSPPQDVP